MWRICANTILGGVASGRHGKANCDDQDALVG